MYEWASDLADERKAARKQRARNKRLAVLNAELLGALLDLLGDQPDIQSWICVRCGRDYIAEPALEGADCPSDDCPGYRARHLCARAKAGAL
ncbi:MAG: hypothetical protein ABL904_08250, partial [Hyphomicrobiaceae bacterium]